MSATTRFKRLAAGQGLLLLLLAGSGCSAAPASIAPPEKTVQFGLYAQVTFQRLSSPRQRFLVLWRRYQVGSAVEDSIEIKDTLGSTQARLVRNSALTTLERANGKKVSGRDADALLKQLTGYTLPVEAFGHWVRGYADGRGAAEQETNPDGTASRISQYGFNIIYLSYDDDKRPKKINVLDARDLEIQVDIRRWL